MSLTGPPPPLPPGIANAAPLADVPEAVVQVLAARQPGAAGVSSQEALNAATGPGNVVTGQVTELTLNGNATVVTPTGAEVTLRNLPTQIMQLGSTVALRIASQSAGVQATLLSVDGKPAAGLLARAALVAGGTLAPPAATVPATPAPYAPPASSAVLQANSAPLIDSASAMVASLAATIGAANLPPLTSLGLGDDGILPPPEPGIDPSLLSGMASAGGQTRATGDGATLIATLVRASLPKPGGVAPPLGTRYALSITAVASPEANYDTAAAPSDPLPSSPAQPQAASPLPPIPAAAASPASSAAIGQPAPAAPTGPAAPAVPTQEITGDFIPQVTVLAGRVSGTTPAGGIEIETALGTLALPTTSIVIPIGSAAQLRVTAVAPPLVHAPAQAVQVDVAATAEAPVNPSPIAEALGALMTAQPAIAEIVADTMAAATSPHHAASPAADIAEMFTITPDSSVVAILLGFLAGSAPVPARRWPDSPARKALSALGRDNLVQHLDGDAARIGATVPAPPPSAWLVTTLPYFGNVSTQPMRLYRKAEDGGKGVKANRLGEHFVLEVDLARLGPMQFEGLIRDRRFDLVLRTRQPLHGALQQTIRKVYADTLLAAGYAGDFSFARAQAFPLVPPISAAGHREVSA